MSTAWAENKSEIEDYLQDQDARPIMKGEAAPYDGMVAPFNTISTMYSFYPKYIELKDKYENGALVLSDYKKDLVNEFAKSALLLSVGLALGYSISGADQTTKTIALGLTSVAIIGSVVVLTF